MRRRALSPVRILIMVLMLPVTTLVIAVGVYMRTSEFEPEEALIHLIALAGCKPVESLVPGPFLAGGPGYHLRNDPDGDGVACGTYSLPTTQNTSPQQAESPGRRAVGNAKFVRP
ncbi:excalibur calcium-binding domain-containing protein [Ruegeria lacuscaerulensis]|uniref:excalibur calcium-binding domain-containing protein n=1 Tax=Ruegeria lacuscaerulensis TaxID=55218 RepID=UPI00147C8FB9|nr:excalibur calcium-binding domain-containing protein [Ruegeria lacuscaerulensis]